MSEREQTYVAWNPCGCMAGACVNDPNHIRETAKMVGDFIRSGCTVELVRTEWVRKTASFAPCVDNPACVRLPRRARAKQTALAL